MRIKLYWLRVFAYLGTRVGDALLLYSWEIVTLTWSLVRRENRILLENSLRTTTREERKRNLAKCRNVNRKNSVGIRAGMTFNRIFIRLVLFFATTKLVREKERERERGHIDKKNNVVCVCKCFRRHFCFQISQRKRIQIEGGEQIKI